MTDKYSSINLISNLKKSIKNLPIKIRSKIYLLIFFNLIANIFEVVGILLILPITALFLGLGNNNYKEYIIYLQDNFTIFNNQSSLIILSLFKFINIP